MEINKRTILWIVFSVSLVVLWNDWMVSNGKQSMFSSTPPAKTATVATPAPVSGLPLAAQLIGAHGDDLATLGAARLLAAEGLVPQTLRAPETV